MTAEQFWKKFKENICGNEELSNVWNNTKEFTRLIMNQLDEKILASDSLEEIKTEREYFRIDLISYKDTSKNKISCGKLQNCSWDLIAAVEHENDSRLWVDEVVKLAHIACPLRVVIGYLPKKQKDIQIAHSKYLKKVTETLNQIDAWKYTSKYGDYLIIIGDCELSKNDIKCSYTPYLYEQKSQSFEYKRDWQ